LEDGASKIVEDEDESNSDEDESYSDEDGQVLLTHGNRS